MKESFSRYVMSIVFLSTQNYIEGVLNENRFYWTPKNGSQYKVMGFD